MTPPHRRFLRLAFFDPARGRLGAIAVDGPLAIAAGTRSETGSGPARASRRSASRSTRSLTLRYLGSRSFHTDKTGVATKIDEYAPIRRPTRRARARSLSVSAPSSPAPTNRSPPTGRMVASDVFRER